MSFVRKFSGDRTMPIVAVYTCAVHGEFDAEVERDENGEAPDSITCSVFDPNADCIGCGGQPSAPGAPDCLLCDGACVSPCSREATWTPSPVGCRVRRVEVTRGKYEKPERKTYLDTRKLGEGQPIEEFQAERRKIWRDVRMDQARKEFVNK